MNDRINATAAILALSLGLAATPAFAQVHSFDRGVAHRVDGDRIGHRNAGSYYDGIVAGEIARSNDDASAADGNAEQPERLVPQFGQE